MRDKSSSSVVQAVSAMLNYRGNGLSVKELIDNGGTPKSAIENTLKDSVVLDISGCTVEEILFYVSKGSPVFAMTGTDSAVLVTDIPLEAFIIMIRRPIPRGQKL